METRSGWEGLRESGADSVEFLLAANPGQPPRSLARTASGGELSRVLLGLKCALAGAGGDETLVFDEIDAGIGGGRPWPSRSKLRELAGAVAGDGGHPPGPGGRPGRRATIVIEKSQRRRGGPVTRLVAARQATAVVEELCRMMGGRPDDAEAMAHARDLRDRAAVRPARLGKARGSSGHAPPGSTTARQG